MNRGFTLVEVVISVALFAVLMTAVVNVAIFYWDTFAREKEAVDVQVSANAIMDAVRDAGLQADRFTSHSFAGVPYASSASSVVFELPAVDSSGSIIANAYDYVAVYGSGTEAYELADLSDESARPLPPSKKISDTLSSLVFTYNNADPGLATSVTADATTTASYKSTSASAHLFEQVYLRNL